MKTRHQEDSHKRKKNKPAGKERKLWSEQILTPADEQNTRKKDTREAQHSI